MKDIFNSENTISFFNPTYNNDYKRYFEFISNYQIQTFEFGQYLDKPLFTDPEKECNSGIWAWLDKKTSIYWMLTTDAYRKNSEMGGKLFFRWDEYQKTSNFDGVKISNEMLNILFISAQNFMHFLLDGKHYIPNESNKYPPLT